jgi:large subunit ribosomal protein L30
VVVAVVVTIVVADVAAPVVDAAVPVADVAAPVVDVAAPALDVAAPVVGTIVARKGRDRLQQLRQEGAQMAAAKKSVRLVTAEQEEAPAAVAEETPAMESQPEVARGPFLRVTLVKSGIGYKYDQKRTLAALGLRRLNLTVERPDNPCVRGMLNKVEHLVRVEEIGQS